MISVWALLGLGLETVAQAQLSVPPYATVGASPYRINPGDELEIHVWGDERLQRDVLVLPDGTFDFPLVGQVNAAGRLPGDIERVITTGLQPQYKGPVPQVTVSVKKASGYQFSVVGKVRNPGTFTDRKSTRLNSSHSSISYAVFCLKKKKRHQEDVDRRGKRHRRGEL